jgi:hypothetical protein
MTALEGFLDCILVEAEPGVVWHRFRQFREGYLRLSVANSIENIEKALDRAAAWVKKNL